MKKEDKLPVDPETGLKERTVNIEDILEAKNIPSWGKPRGIDLFERVEPAINYISKQQQQELWMYNRRMLTGVST